MNAPASLEALRQALDLHAIVSVTDLHGCILEVNDTFCQISGYARSELLGQNHRILKSGRHPDAFYADMWHTISAGQTWQGEICNRAKNGSEYWVRSTIIPVLDGNGLPHRYISIRTDITPHMTLERELQEKEALYRSLVTTVADGIVLFDQRGKVIECNPAAETIFGQHRDQLVRRHNLRQRGLHISANGAPLDPKKHPVLLTLERGEEQREVVMGVYRPDGSLVWVKVATKPVYSPETGDVVCGVVASYTDVTRLRETEVAALQSIIQLESTIQAIPDVLLEMDSDGSYFHQFQTGSETQFPYLPQRPIDDFLPADVAQTLRQAVAEAQKTGRSQGRVISLITNRGHRSFELSAAKKQTIGNGQTQRFMVVARDITRRKEFEARFAFAVEGAGDCVWDWDIKTSTSEFSTLYDSMLGYEPGEIPRNCNYSTMHPLVHPKDHMRVKDTLTNYLQGKQATYEVELRLRCKDKQYKWFLNRGTIVERDAAGNPVRMIGILSDISKRKHTEEQLLVFRRLVESTEHTTIRVSDKDGLIQYVNPAYEKLMGYTLAEVMGRPFHTIAKFVGDEAIANERLEAVAQGKPWRGMANIVNRYGQRFDMLNNISYIKDPETGEVLHSFNISVDQTEEIALQQQLKQAVAEANAANRAKSDFLSSMSHELRTPMNAIIGFAQILEYDDGLDPEQQDNVHEILKAGRHLLSLINEVLDLAKIESGRIDLSLEPVQLHSLTEECWNLLQPLATKKRVAFQLNTDNNLCVQADRTRLKQVVLNLLSNAIKYNREGGQITVDCTAHGATGRLTVSDTGQGIAPDRLQEVFQAFNRLDAENSHEEGTGIGLTISKRLVQLMGGEIGLSSTLAVGTQFWINLPSCTDVLPAQALQPIASTQWNCHDEISAQNLVLYIDDNPANLKLMEQIFSRKSHVGLITSHSAELGLELAMAHHPDLILLDINMPGMDGYMVMDILRSHEQLKRIPVIAVTANAMPDDIAHGQSAGFTEYLTKPLDMVQLLDAVYRCIAPKDAESHQN